MTEVNERYKKMDACDISIEEFKSFLAKETKIYDAKDKVSIVEMIRQEQFEKLCKWSIESLEYMKEEVQKW